MKKYIFIASLLVLNLSLGQVGINTNNPQGILNVDGAKDNPATGNPTAVQQANDFIVTEKGSVGIGTTNPDPSAILQLDVSALASGSQKGFLGPKVTLTSNTDQTTIPNPAVGLLVYNLGTDTNFKTKGYLYWSGSEWLKLGTRTSVTAGVGTLSCETASLSPLTYEEGVPFQGILKVPYTDGNGGSYAGGVPIESTGVTGLTAVLQPGNLEYGTGELIYNVEGTPSDSSPELATFTITLGDKSCAVSVGAREIKRGDSEYFSGNNTPANVTGVLFSAYDEMPNIEDILLFDVYCSGSSNGTGPVSIVPRVYNMSSSPVKIWWQGFTSIDGRGDGNVLLASGGYQNLDNGMFLGYGRNHIEGSTTPQTSVSYSNSAEGYSFDFIFDNKWYRVEMSFAVDNKNTSNTSDNVRMWYSRITRMF